MNIFKARWIIPVFSIIVISVSCEKKEIQFATALGETYTNITQIDTVAIDMSTYLLDSFPTNSTESFSLGLYTDSLLGSTTAKPFVQLGLPEDLTIESGSSFDSLSLIIRFNRYYYGDTMIPATFTVRELVAPIEYSYGNYLFNTSSIAESAAPLGVLTARVFPSTVDSIIIPLNNAKGLELFQKLQQQATEIKTAEAFLNYFKGVSIEGNAASPGNIFGITATPDSVYMRLNYHINTPYKEERYKDFRFNQSMYFNQLIQNRSSTKLNTALNPVRADVTGGHAYTQSGTGTVLKMTFPSLRNILQLDPAIKLLSATLTLRVSPGSFDGKALLPEVLFLASTDATNTIGSYLADPGGSSQLYATPVSDAIYSNGTSYSFNVTNYINTLLVSGGSENSGFFLLEENPGTLTTVNRVIINGTNATVQSSKLSLTVLTFNNN